MNTHLLLAPLLATIPGLAFEVSAADFPYTDPTNTQGWVLVDNLSDEFDGTLLNETKWLIQGRNGEFRSNFKGRAPSQFSTNNVRVENGKLKLETRWEPSYPFNPATDSQGVSYENITTAAVITRNQFLYGYMEIRCKAANASITSAFWTTGSGSELDIFESTANAKINGATLAKEMWSSIHDWSKPTSNSAWTQKTQLPFTWGGGFHTYAADWDDESVRFYADGQLVHSVTKAQVIASGANWVMNVPQWLWVDQETFTWRGVPVEGDFPANGSGGRLPIDYEIEYIRVWQKPPNGPPVFAGNPITKSSATEGVAFSGSLAGDASDPEGDPMTFTKVSGPGWMNVAANGALSGFPSFGNLGTNSFSVQVSAKGGSSTSALNVTINPGPWKKFATLNGLSGSKTADKDSDGVNDWTEYVFGGNPNNPSDKGITPAVDAASGQLSFALRNDSALQTRILTSTTLEEGSWTIFNAVNGGTNDGQMATRSIPVNTSEDRRFFRVEAVDPTPPNQAPVFSANPIVKPNATQGVAYTDSLVGDVSDPEGDPITFTKIQGVGWLTIGSNGSLTGTPGSNNVGLNSFVVRANGPGNNSTAMLNITVNAPVSYPASKGNSVAYEWIDSVNIGSIHSTTEANGGYYNGTALSTTATKGSTVSVSLSPGFNSTGPYNEVWRIWIDLNHDGDFADAGEQVFSATGSAAVSGSFTLPSTYPFTGATRMRVSMRYQNAPPSNANFDYGEVEDYTIIIQ